jgi:hypothetical protein
MNFRPRTPVKVATVLCTGAALACASTGLAADTGGSSFQTAAAGHSARHALLGHRVAFRGEARRGSRVAVQRLDHGTWRTVATATANRHNRYRAVWRTNHIGVFQMRTIPLDAATVRASSVDAPTRLIVYRPAVATWFGRGLYGHKTACGQTLSPTLMGVAHRSLPCGTKVSFFWGGRTITVPVVDRGPFGAGISWDLTTAASDALGFTARGRVTLGAVSLHRR